MHFQGHRLVLRINLTLDDGERFEDASFRGAKGDNGWLRGFLLGWCSGCSEAFQAVGGNQFDELLAVRIDFRNELIDPAEEVQIGEERGDGHEHARRGGDEGFGNAGSHHFALAGFL